MINNDELEQEIFSTYTMFPDKDKSFEFCLGMIYTLEKYKIINELQVKHAFSYNKNLHSNFE